MSTAAAEHAVGKKLDPHFGTASNGKLGMWIFLLTDGMGFAGLLIGLAIMRAGAPAWPPNPEVDKLGIPFTAVMTFVLILSSVTMVMALAACGEKNKKATMGWLAATIAGGLFFLCGQAKEWTGLIREGMTITSDHFGAFFYVVTGYHGLHVLTGVLYLTASLIRTSRKGTTPEHANFLEIAGLFWHFVDLVWILVFTFIYLIPSPQAVATAAGAN
jgi:heme/copper-type cytochrome/quinol oxidase subunit 3